MVNDYSFKNQLNFHKSWEKKISEKILKILPNLVELLHIETKKSGTGFTCVYKTGRVEVKIRNDNRIKKYYPKTIVLEIVSVVETKKPGWIYTTDADYVVECWEFNDELMPIGFIIHIKELRESNYFKEDIPTRMSEGIYPVIPVQSEGGKWHTYFIAPSVEDFPSSTLTRFSFIKEKKTILGDVRDY